MHIFSRDLSVSFSEAKPNLFIHKPEQHVQVSHSSLFRLGICMLTPDHCPFSSDNQFCTDLSYVINGALLSWALYIFMNHSHKNKESEILHSFPN